MAPCYTHRPESYTSSSEKLAPAVDGADAETTLGRALEFHRRWGERIVGTKTY